MPPEFLPTHHRSLRLQNFTAFGDAAFEFVPGVNVLVGENGTGKTHVLKLLNHYSTWRHLGNSVLDVEELFSLPSVADIGQILRLGESQGYVDWPSNWPPIRLVFGKNPTDFGGNFTDPSLLQDAPRSVLIPPTDMIAHTRGYLAIDRDYALDFDRTYADVVTLLELQTKHGLNDLAADEMQALQDRMGGTVEYDAGDRRFYLVTPQ